MEAKDRILVAVDVKSPGEALEIVRELQGEVGGFKLGLELFTNILVRLGTTPEEVDAIDELRQWRELLALCGAGKIAWNNKFADIPNTVGGASAALKPVSPLWFTVHASAGIDAMMAAVTNKGNSMVAAVTVLTSIDETNCQLVFGATPPARVLQFVRDAKLAGVDAIVCSPADLPFLKKHMGKELSGLEYYTPGVRPAGSDKGDQARTDTPGGAIKAGATRVIIGRPVTKPASGTRIEAVHAITAEIVAVIEEMEKATAAK